MAEPTFLRLIRAPNPGPMTLQGTNTWVLGEPGAGPPIVVDPGPLIESHLQAILDCCAGQIASVVLTHRHLDHSASAATLAERAGCGVRSADPSLQIGPEGLAHGDLIQAGGVRSRVVSTPGHTSDSCSLVVEGPDGSVRLLTGDTVLGQGTTVITHPDGNLADYLDSLAALLQITRSLDVGEILPGHGPTVSDPAGVLESYRRHRLERLEQVRRALAAGDRTAAEIVARAYAQVDRSVWPAAEQSVRAQLEYLDSQPDHANHTGYAQTPEASSEHEHR